MTTCGMDGTAAEHVREAIPVIASYGDAMGVRAFAERRDLAHDLADTDFKNLTGLINKPWINMESAIDHPCQSLADWKTMDELGIPQNGKFVLSWGYHPKALPLAVSAANDARKAVDLLAVKGVDYVKVYTRMSPEQIRAVTDEAGTFGLKVTAHLGVTDAITAADMGVKAIEHMSGVPEAALKDNALTQAHRSGFFNGWTAFEKAWARVDSATLARVADRLVEDKVTLVPTLVLHETFSRLDDPALAQSDVYKAVPDSEMAKWNVPGMIARAGWKPEDFVAFRASRANQDLFVRLFRAAGGRVVAGSDAANQMLVPGASLIREIELLVQVGFTPADALLSATRDAAALLNADSLGALVQGRKADLIVLSRDPTVDIANLRTVEQVMVRGHLMSADSLRRHW